MNTYSKSKPAPTDVDPKTFDPSAKSLREMMMMASNTNTICCLFGFDSEGDVTILYMPMEAMDGTAAIVGNLSDNLGTLSPAYVMKDTLGGGFAILEPSEVPSGWEPVTNLGEEHLRDTCWEDMPEAALLFGLTQVPFLFGSNIPEGNILDPDMKDKFAKLENKHYNNIFETMKHVFETYKHASDLDTVLKRIEDDEATYIGRPPHGRDIVCPTKGPYLELKPSTNPNKYGINKLALRATFLPSSATSRPSSGIPPTANPPTLPATNPTQPPLANQSRPGSFPIPNAQRYGATNSGGSIILQSHADVERQSEASTGVIKLAIFGVSFTNVDAELSTLGDPRYCEFTQRFEKAITASPGSRLDFVRGLLRDTFNNKPQGELGRDMLITLLSMKLWQKSLLVSLLSGNLQTEELDSVFTESGQVNILSFVPQTNDTRIAQIEQMELRFKTDDLNGLPDHARKHLKSTIEQLGQVRDMNDVLSILANLCAHLRAVYKMSPEQKPFLYELSEALIYDLKIDPVLAPWFAKFDSQMKHLPFTFVALLQRGFAAVAEVALSGENLERVEAECPANELNVRQIRLFWMGYGRQRELWMSCAAMNVADTNVSSLTPSTFNEYRPVYANSYASALTNDNRQGIQQTKPSHNKKKGNAGAPPTPDEGKKRGGKRTSGGGEPNEDLHLSKGIFHKKKQAHASQVFPSGLTVTPCSDFCCKASSCKNSSPKCRFAHYFMLSNIPSGDLMKICAHAKATGNVWFDEAAIERQKFTLPRGYEGLAGDANGPKST